MNTLLIYPAFPSTFWSFDRALSFLGKKAALPPLGLLTMAALLPPSWNLKLVDLNTRKLRNRDLDWADLVMVGAMTVQEDSIHSILDRCQERSKTVIAGGPAFTCEPEKYQDTVDHLVLGEAELSLPPFLRDFTAGHAKPRYNALGFAPMDSVPTPRYDLLDMRKYASMSIQFSRGCPFDCDFCNVTALFGHRPRTKSTQRILEEMNALWQRKWRGSLFFVDDNFIGNKRYLKQHLLPALVTWQKQRKYGLPLYTEASINLADDPQLLQTMHQAGFDTVFVGLETPSEEALAGCNKVQNQGRSLIEDIKRIQRAGLQVQGGFIVGFDTDTRSIFQRQMDFIQQSGVVTAMVGILQAPAGTRLFERMSREGRLLANRWGDNTSSLTNILPRMGMSPLVDGYRELVQNLYSPKEYYKRIRTLLREYREPYLHARLTRMRLRAFFMSVLRLGILGRERFEYWKLMAWVSLHNLRHLPTAVTLTITGYHFRKVAENIPQD